MQLEFSFVKEVEAQYFKRLSRWVENYAKRETSEIIEKLFFDVYTMTKEV